MFRECVHDFLCLLQKFATTIETLDLINHDLPHRLTVVCECYTNYCLTLQLRSSRISGESGGDRIRLSLAR